MLRSEILRAEERQGNHTLPIIRKMRLESFHLLLLLFFRSRGLRAILTGGGGFFLVGKGRELTRAIWRSRARRLSLPLGERAHKPQNTNRVPTPTSSSDRFHLLSSFLSITNVTLLWPFKLNQGNISGGKNGVTNSRCCCSSRRRIFVDTQKQKKEKWLTSSYLSLHCL